MTNLLDQVVDFYMAWEYKVGEPLSREEAYKIFRRLHNDKRLYLVTGEGGILLGYAEAWRVNHEQLGRIICGDDFNLLTEDVTSGDICYVANVVVHENYRKIGVVNLLKKKVLGANFSCKSIIGISRRKYSSPISVYQRKDYFKELVEVCDGSE